MLCSLSLQRIASRAGGAAVCAQILQKLISENYTDRLDHDPNSCMVKGPFVHQGLRLVEDLGAQRQSALVPSGCLPANKQIPFRARPAFL